ncbi:hypothetical protein ACIQXG_05030 [Lysinibacillus sphaericus]|uniref:hypothetical protein n=1 Tax=Lysinibacillus sphaericus TaxID=1421 RepID=UPI00380AE39B
MLKHHGAMFAILELNYVLELNIIPTISTREKNVKGSLDQVTLNQQSWRCQTETSLTILFI